MYLLIPAAGQGKRMGSDRNKLLLRLLGQPILSWTLRSALQAESIDWIGIMGQPYDFPDFQAILEDLKPNKPVILIEGGNTRQESVYNGLQALPEQAKSVLIHDGARCLVTPDLLDRMSLALLESQGIIAGIPVKDTIKIVNSELVITDTPQRDYLWSAQTPQGFDLKLLKQCHQQGKELGWEVTDDAALFERCHLPVKVVLGEETNLKVTTPIDITLAEFILQSRQ